MAGDIDLDRLQRDVRVSDPERDAVAGLLREHAAVGRLTLDEFSERVAEVYDARTGPELAATLRDLPAPAPPPPPPEEVRKAKSEERRGRIRRFRAELASFVGPNAVCIGIWAAAGHDRFWPRWVLLFTGVGFITSVIKGFDASHKEKKAAKSRT